MKFRMGLRGRVATLIGATAVAAGAISMAVMCAAEKRRQLDRLQSEATIYASLVQEMVAGVAARRGCLSGAPPGLQTIARRLKQLEGVGWLEVFDQTGRVVAHSDPTRIGKKPLSEHASRVRQVLQTGEPVRTASPDQRVLTSFLPVYALGATGTEPVGVVELELTTDALESDLARFGRSLMWITLIATVAASLTLFVAIDRDVLRPVHNLAEKAMLLGGSPSNLGLRRHRDELAELDATVRTAFEILGHKARASEERFRNLITALPYGVQEVDRSGRIIYTNLAEANLFGYEGEEILGKFFWDLAAFESDRERFEHLWAGSLRTGSTPPPHRMTSRTKQGRTIEVQVDWACDLDPAGEPRGYIAVLTDVTESARAEKVLQESEARLRAVLENMPVMMDASLSDGTLVLWNRECERVTGYPAEEVVGKPWHEERFYADSETRRALLEEWRKRRGDFRNWENEIVCRDGTRKTVAWSSVSARVPIAGWASWSVGVDVTDRVRMERSLRESESMLRSITNSIPDIVMVVDLDGTIRFVNRPAPGLKKEDIVGASVFDYGPPYLRARLEEAFRRVSSGGPSEQVDGELLTPNDEVVPYDVRIARIPREQGPVQLVMSCTDVTERRRAEKRFRAHYKHFPMPTYTFQYDGRALIFVDFNDAAYQITQGLVPRLLGKSCQELYADEPGIIEDFERCFHGRETVRREYRYRFRTTGEQHQLDVTYAFVPPDLVMMHTEDIGDRKAAEEALRANRESLAQAQRIAHIGNWDWNVTTNELRWSDEIYRIFGLEPQEFGATYEAFLEMVHPDDREAVEEAVGRALRERHRYGISHRIVRKDGVECVVQEQGDVIYDELGRPARMVGTVQDVTLRQRAEQQLVLALEEKETLLREIHHRVKNNLQVISSLLYLQSQKVSDPALTRLFEEMQKRVETMALIHENLYQSADLGRVDFHRYIEMLVNGLTAAHSQSGRSIRIVAEVEDVFLRIHTAVPCGLIVNELVTNAFRHAFANGAGGTVRIEFRRDGGQCLLSVRDDGVGLPSEIAVDRSTTLGLRLVHSLTDQLRARLEVSRESGTAFRITFQE